VPPESDSLSISQNGSAHRKMPLRWNFPWKPFLLILFLQLTICRVSAVTS